MNEPTAPRLPSTEEKIDLTTVRNYKVVKSNEIIQKARYDLNVSELRILSFILSKIKPNDTALEEYEFSIKEYCLVCGIDEKNGGNYAAIKRSLQSLRDKSFWLMDENGVESTVGWLGKARISKGSGKIRVKLDEDLQKYVVGLFDNYTQYELLSTLPMKSAYSYRIYEELRSYAFTGKHEFDLDYLKHKLMAERYVNFKDFRRAVIETAVREINLYTDIEVSWEPVKSGKKVARIIFYIHKRDAWGIAMASGRATQQLDGQLSLDTIMNEKEITALS